MKTLGHTTSITYDTDTRNDHIQICKPLFILHICVCHMVIVLVVSPPHTRQLSWWGIMAWQLKWPYTCTCGPSWLCINCSDISELLTVIVLGTGKICMWQQCTSINNQFYKWYIFNKHSPGADSISHFEFMSSSKEGRTRRWLLSHQQNSTRPLYMQSLMVACWSCWC